ncbi:MAG TPA: hypothetical protein ENG58_06400 [Thermotogales bacterium]|nr:hypothetical protein [Thermotogales bacterium]
MRINGFIIILLFISILGFSNMDFKANLPVGSSQVEKVSSVSIPKYERKNPRFVLAFYYAWYGTPDGPMGNGRWLHWYGPGMYYQGTDHPLRGMYDSWDEEVLKSHMLKAHESGIDGFVVSWWGPGSYETDTVKKMLKISHDMKRDGKRFYISIYYEGYEYSTKREAVDDLCFAIEEFAGDEGFLKLDGKPVIFIYSRAINSLSKEDWKEVVERVRKRCGDVVFIADTMDGKFARIFGGMHVYNVCGAFRKLPAMKVGSRFMSLQAKLNDVLYVMNVMPGYDDTHVRVPGFKVDREKGKLYEELWKLVLEIDPDLVIITSWNEWHEGSEIEPSEEYGNLYLKLTKKWATRWKNEKNRSSSNGTDGFTYVLDLSDQFIRYDEGLAIKALQGIVNKKGARLYVIMDSSDKYWFERIKKTFGLKIKIIKSFNDALKIFKNEVKGCVLYDLKNVWEVNLITTISGILKAIPLTDADYDLPILLDIRGKFPNEIEAYRWIVDEYFDEISKEGVVELGPFTLHLRDFIVSNDLLVFSLSPLDEKHRRLLENVLSRYPVRTPVFGWPPTGWGNDGFKVEVEFVNLISKHGLGLIASDYVSNLSFFSKFKIDIPFAQIWPYHPSAHGGRYVSFVVSDGDNLQYMLNYMTSMWDENEREKLELGWTVAPLSSSLMEPVLSIYYIDSWKSKNDCFVAGPSGLFYVSPSLLPNPREFILRTIDTIKRLSMNSVVILDWARTKILNDVLTEFSRNGVGVFLFAGLPTPTYRSDRPVFIASSLDHLDLGRKYNFVYVNAWKYSIGGIKLLSMKAMNEGAEVVCPGELTRLAVEEMYSRNPFECGEGSIRVEDCRERKIHGHKFLEVKLRVDDLDSLATLGFLIEDEGKKFYSPIFSDEAYLPLVFKNPRIWIRGFYKSGKVVLIPVSERCDDP